MFPCFLSSRKILTYPAALGNQLPNTYLWEKQLKDGLVKDLTHRGPGNTYTDWDPWAQGFTRYGYGEPKDWREERRLNANYGRYRLKNSKEGRNGSRSQKAVQSSSGQGHSNATIAGPLEGDETLNLRGGPQRLTPDIHSSIKGSKKKRKAKIPENLGE